jgi:hypothetical protein
MYAQVEPRSEWKEMALQGADFLEKYHLAGGSPQVF